MDSSRTQDVKPRINTADESDKAKTWKMADISDSSNLKALRLPDTAAAPSKVLFLFLIFPYYTFSSSPFYSCNTFLFIFG